ncbi:MAG: S41 family peptidase [Bacteroidota bacterium]
MRKTITLFCLLILLAHTLSAQLSPEALQKDLLLLKESLATMHPGLHKYMDATAVEEAYEVLQSAWSEEQSTLTAYGHLSTFLAKIKCGHTYANFWNQEGELEQLFVHAANKVPFTFRIIDHNIYIDQVVTDEEGLQRGDRLLSINGIATATILEALLQYVKADGSNDAKRLFDLQLFGLDNYEAFDIYLPLVIDLQEEVEVVVEDHASKTEKQFRLPLLTRQERYDRIGKKYGNAIESYDDYWSFRYIDEQTAYLQLGTFVTWRMSIKWKSYLNKIFKELNKKAIPHLILDIRGNGGGNADVQQHLYKKLTNRKATVGPFQQTLRTNYIPKHLRPHLYLRLKKYFNQQSKTVRLNDDFYTYKKNGLLAGTRAPKSSAYQGEVYLLADASNSSGTYFLINYLKNNKLATVIGQTSGGNQQGITAGQMAILTLPHSKIAVDIPLIGYYPTTKQPDAGIQPDIFVPYTVEDFMAQRDTEVEMALELIKKYTNEKK